MFSLNNFGSKSKKSLRALGVLCKFKEHFGCQQTQIISLLSFTTLTKEFEDFPGGGGGITTWPTVYMQQTLSDVFVCANYYNMTAHKSIMV